MLISSRGVVLSSIKYGDTSVITKMITRDHGFISFLIQGVFRKKARISYSQLQPFTLLDIVYYYKENRHLHKVREVRAQPTLNNLQSSVVKSAIALFAVEVLNNVLSENERDDSLFHWLENYIIHLDGANNIGPYIAHRFLIELSIQLGFEPSMTEQGTFFNITEGRLTQSTHEEGQYMTAEETQVLKSLMRDRAEAWPKATHQMRSELLDQLIRYFEKHASGFRPLKSVKVLHHVFS